MKLVICETCEAYVAATHTCHRHAPSPGVANIREAGNAIGMAWPYRAPEDGCCEGSEKGNGEEGKQVTFETTPKKTERPIKR